MINEDEIKLRQWALEKSLQFNPQINAFSANALDQSRPIQRDKKRIIQDAEEIFSWVKGSRVVS